jgi:hypothetical protein
VSPDVRAVLGIQGEPGTPEEPAQGKVWRSIVEHLDNGGAQNEFVTVTNLPRETFAKHPWSIGGGGALELKDLLESNAVADIAALTDAVGITAVTGEDALFVLGGSDICTRFRHLKNSEPCMIGASEGARAQSTTIGHHSSSGTNALWFARRNRYEPKDHIRCPFTTHICGS